MKVLLLAIFFMITVVYGNENFYQRLTLVRRLTRSVPQLQHGRFKRQSIFQLFCIEQCTNGIDDIVTKLESMPDGKVQQMLMDGPETLDKVCDEVDEMRDCIDGCGNFTGKQEAMRPFKIVDFICEEHYDEFIENLPCFVETEERVEDECGRECGGSEFHEKQEELIDQYNAAGDIFGMMEVLKKTCSSLSCAVGCQRPIMYEVCGDNEASKLVDQFVQLTMQEVKHVFTTAGVGFLFPHSCNQIANGRHPEKLIYKIVKADPEF